MYIELNDGAIPIVKSGKTRTVKSRNDGLCLGV